MVNDNYEIYGARREPIALSRLRSGKLPFYPSIRTINNPLIIKALMKEVKEQGEDWVVVSWITPPYGRVIGYGLYTRAEADDLLRESTDERWSSPDVGRIYDIGKLEKKLSSLKKDCRSTHLDTAL